MLRSTLLLFFLFSFLIPGSAQRISGRVPSGAAGDGFIHLAVSRGSSARPVDSAAVRADGSFLFEKHGFPRGFYHLSINDSDQVDIILDPAETHLEIGFSGTPLQRHVSVKRSDANKQLWDYKLVSRESQAIQAAVAAEKLTLQPTDTTRLHELDSVAARAVGLQQAYLDGIVNGHPDSYFAKIIRADRGIEAAREKNPLAVLKVFDFSDPELMRSSVYDDAVMTFLRNIRAVSEEQFLYASDSLLAYAGGDAECRAYMLEHLVDLFSTYGPELVVEHLIDAYIVPAGFTAIDPALHAKIAELLKVAVGATAADVELPGMQGPVPLSSVVAKNNYTLMFFYSSTCDHCHAEMPVLKEVYAEFKAKGLGVIGIALDTDSLEFQAGIASNSLPWPCYSDLKGWGSPVAKAFHVKATPWFYLLDQRMKILVKPVNALALRDWLEKNAR